MYKRQPEGQIVYKDMISISPYGNTLVVRRLTGQQLLNVLEHAIDIGIQCDAVYTLQKQAVANGEDPYQYAWPENSGSYLQFSGISATYDVTRPAGSRVIQAQIGGAPLDLSLIHILSAALFAGCGEYRRRKREHLCHRG